MTDQYSDLKERIMRHVEENTFPGQTYSPVHHVAMLVEALDAIRDLETQVRRLRAGIPRVATDAAQQPTGRGAEASYSRRQEVLDATQQHIAEAVTLAEQRRQVHDGLAAATSQIIAAVAAATLLPDDPAPDVSDGGSCDTGGGEA